jgi:hypothetical protein
MKLLIKHTQYFTLEVEPDRLDELGSWQDVVDLDMDESDLEPVMDDQDNYFEFVKVVDND